MQAVKDVKIESKQLHEQVEKLEKILEAYKNDNHLEDHLDELRRYVCGLTSLSLRTWMDEKPYRTLEDKKAALENKLPVDRSLGKRIVHSTKDRDFLVQVLREMTRSIDITTVMSLYCPIAEIQHVFPVRYKLKDGWQYC